MVRQTSSHSVFTDLAFRPAEAENLRIRSAMMRALLAAAGLRVDLKVKKAA